MFFGIKNGMFFCIKIQKQNDVIFRLDNIQIILTDTGKRVIISLYLMLCAARIIVLACDIGFYLPRNFVLRT